MGAAGRVEVPREVRIMTLHLLVHWYLLEFGCAPTLREMSLVGRVGLSTVHLLVDIMEARGLVRRCRPLDGERSRGVMTESQPKYVPMEAVHLVYKPVALSSFDELSPSERRFLLDNCFGELVAMLPAPAGSTAADAEARAARRAAKDRERALRNYYKRRARLADGGGD